MEETRPREPRPEPPLRLAPFSWYTIGSPIRWLWGAFVVFITLILLPVYLNDAQRDNHLERYLWTLLIVLTIMFASTVNLIIRKAHKQTAAVRANASDAEFRAAEEIKNTKATAARELREVREQATRAADALKTEVAALSGKLASQKIDKVAYVISVLTDAIIELEDAVGQGACTQELLDAWLTKMEWFLRQAILEPQYRYYRYALNMTKGENDPVKNAWGVIGRLRELLDDSGFDSNEITHKCVSPTWPPRAIPWRAIDRPT